MAFIIDGSTGIATVDGSVSAPSQRGQDTNSGISYASDTIKFSTNGVERMAITNSGVTGTGIGAGKVLQSKSFTKNDVTTFDLSSGYFSNSTQTGIQVSITPSNASNKILLLGIVHVDVAGGQYNIGLALEKAGSILSGAIGDTAGNRKRVTSLGTGYDHTSYAPTIPFIYEDTAGGTSAITYGITVNNPSSISRTVYINRAETDTDSTSYRRGISTITAMEIEP